MAALLVLLSLITMTAIVLATTKRGRILVKEGMTHAFIPSQVSLHESKPTGKAVLRGI